MVRAVRRKRRGPAPQSLPGVSGTRGVGRSGHPGSSASGWPEGDGERDRFGRGGV